MDATSFLPRTPFAVAFPLSLLGLPLGLLVGSGSGWTSSSTDSSAAGVGLLRFRGLVSSAGALVLTSSVRSLGGRPLFLGLSGSSAIVSFLALGPRLDCFSMTADAGSSSWGSV